MDINGHGAIVTGGGSGLGEATARLLASRGAKVAIFDLNMDGANRVAADIGGVAIQCDVSSAESAEAAVAKAVEAVGTPRAVVNCAGIGSAHAILSREGEPMPLATYSKMIEINLIGTFNILRLVAAAMAKSDPINEDEERGVFINTASVAAYEGQIGQVAYASSKAGVNGMMLPAARELARYGIRVMTIAPGYIQTPMLETVPEEYRENLKKSQVFPRKRFGQPEEYAQLCLSIVENTMLNADTIRLDAGTRMPPK